MDVMYLKYIHGRRYSIINEGGNIIINDSKIIPFKPAEKIEVNKPIHPYKSEENIITSTHNDEINEKITNFFFDSIHKNYLYNRK
ncbi:hypothetical protein DIC82_10770 [Clostridium beijerinckii]|nr:hypothetical protein DIC82_10770 [Clostridium beijerinckii]